ncbi:MAG: hypothetical protein GXP08_06750 [Gammaproteobacteria bacterium]|nr:hypothetical protein [Gammaproteobacteria bacterium]
MRHFVCLLFFLLVIPVTGSAALFAERIARFEGELDQPSDVAISHDGRAYVLDGVNNRVVVYMPDGEKNFIFGRSGNTNSSLRQPMGIALTKTHLYIADSGHHRIAVFTLRGEFVKSLMLPGKLPPEPVSVSVVDDVLTWGDRRNHNICRTDVNSGETLLCWGKRGDAEGEFQFPFQLQSDRDGYIHVVDVLNGRIQIFNHQGRHFGQVGRFGLDAGELYRPNGLAFYRDGYLLVSDAYRGTVTVYRDGRFVGRLVDARNEVLHFAAPVGLTVWRHHLYVVDSLNSRVEVLRLGLKDPEPMVERNSITSVLSQKNCSICHLAWAPDYGIIENSEGEQDGVPPVATERMCYSCHHGAVLDSRHVIGRGEQHPDIHHQRQQKRNKNVSQERQDDIPKAFPLVAVGDFSSKSPQERENNKKQKKQLSCSSCHTPHTADIEGADTLYGEHKNPWLRVLNNNGDLCQQCHKSKLDSVLGKERLVTGVNHPVGIYLKAPPANQVEGYATSKKLHNGLPESLAANGLTLGRDQQMICQSCHQIHGAINEALTPLSFDDSRLCAECHDRQYAQDAKDARKKGVHPVNIELEEAIKVGDNEIKKITCLTCHSVHDGEAGTALLKHKDDNGKLCNYCHDRHGAIVNSDHDLRVTANEFKNRFGLKPQQSGVCGTCHTMHRGNSDVPFLYAGEFRSYEGKEPALARDRLCLDCHRNKGSAEEVIVEHFSHPSKDLVLRSAPKIMPLLNAKNEIEMFGSIACITCHEPHRWEAGSKTPKLDTLFSEEALFPAKNQDGNVLNSFLRRKGAKGTFCVDCHGLETRVKYKYYHDELVRDKGIDYLK